MFFKRQKYALLLVLALSSCMKVDIPSPNGGNASKRVSFDIEVTREGESIPPERQANMNGATKAGSSNGPFGLIGIDYDHNALVVDNEAVSSTGGSYDLFFDALVWDELNTKNVTFSAYYPYVHNIIYDDGLDAYSIPYTIEETSAGPLVSKTVEMAVAQMNMVPLEFQHGQVFNNAVFHLVKAKVVFVQDLLGVLEVQVVFRHFAPGKVQHELDET